MRLIKIYHFTNDKASYIIRRTTLSYTHLDVYKRQILGLKLTGEDADKIGDRWTLMDLCGGKSQPLAAMASDVLSVSADCAADPVKMEILCKFFEDCGTFNESFANIRSIMFMYPEEGRNYEIENGNYTTWALSEEERASADAETVARCV